MGNRKKTKKSAVCTSFKHLMGNGLSNLTLEVLRAFKRVHWSILEEVCHSVVSEKMGRLFLRMTIRFKMGLIESDKWNPVFSVFSLYCTCKRVLCVHNSSIADCTKGLYNIDFTDWILIFCSVL